MTEVVSMSAAAARSARNRAHNQMVWRKLAFFTVLMFVLPIATFFGVKRLIAAETSNADMWSGFSAVLMVNIVIGIYILSAFLEKEEKEVVPPVGRFAAKKNE